MRRRTKAIAASAAVAIAVILAAIVLLATLQTALTTESARNEQNPLYVQPQPNVQARVGESATAGNLTFRVQDVMNGTDPEARQVWATNAADQYAPLNPIQGSTYAIVNVTVANAMNRTTPFSYSHVVLVGNDGRAYYANYVEGTTSCRASLAAEQLKPGTCNVYIAFSIPDDVAPIKIVYTASNPAIVVNLA